MIEVTCLKYSAVCEIYDSAAWSAATDAVTAVVTTQARFAALDASIKHSYEHIEILKIRRCYISSVKKIVTRAIVVNNFKVAVDVIFDFVTNTGCAR